MLKSLKNRIFISMLCVFSLTTIFVVMVSRFHYKRMETIETFSNKIQDFQYHTLLLSNNSELKTIATHNLTRINEYLVMLRDYTRFSLNKSYIISGIILLLFTLIIGWFLSQHITRPLEQLSKKISRFLANKSKWEINVDFNETSEEIHHFLMQFEKLGFYLREIIRSKDEIIEILNFERLHYMQLMESLPVGIFETDVNGKIVYVNEYFQDKFNCEAKTDDYYISNLFNLLSEKALVTCSERLELFEFEARNKTGQTFPALMTLNRVSYEPCRNGFLGIVMDITDHKENIISLKKEKLKAQELDKQKSVFLANVSHEIRTPLNGILGFSELLTDPRYKNEKEKRQFINQIRQNSELLLKIINDIIDFTKIEAGKIEIHNNAVDIHSLLADIYEHFRHIIDKSKPDLKFYLQSEYMKRIVINTDKQRLSQVLINLIGNAVKFTSHGSISIIYGIENDQLVIKIKDTGIGIPYDKQNKIFERFVQADNTINNHYGGTGLGLAISKQLTEMMDGNISLVSEPGNGSTFKILLPVQILEKELPLDIDTGQTKFEFDNRTILIVEDNDDSFELLQAILKPTDALIIRACNGDEALRIFSDFPNISLILMNIGMPKLNGIETIKKIRKRNINVPIIVQSAFAIRKFIDDAMLAGSNDYIVKPIKRTLLLEKINYFLETLVDQEKEKNCN